MIHFSMTWIGNTQKHEVIAQSIAHMSFRILGVPDFHFYAHNPSGPVANAVTLALGVSTPGYCIHETLFDDVPWRKDVIDEEVKFKDGFMYPSDRPGLGIELNEEAAAAHPKADHWLRHYVGTLTNVRPPDSVKYYHQ